MMEHLHLEKRDVRVAVSTITRVLNEVGYGGFLRWLKNELQREQKQFDAAIAFMTEIVND